MSSTAAWLAEFGEERSNASEADTLAAPTGRRLRLPDEPAGGPAAPARSGRYRIIFDGVLYNRTELRARFADRLPSEPTNADLVEQAYECWGDDSVHRVKGIFTLIIWDRVQDLLLCARDPLGMHPLFYAEAGRTLLLSPSIEALLAHPGVSTEINRACLVDRLTRRWPAIEETYFTHVRRVPPGHVMRISRDGRRVYRYWNPVPSDRAIDWIPDGEAQQRFDALLEQAIDRCLTLGPAGIYLSGGLDSSTVAMVAADLCLRQGRAAPTGLSLSFAGLDCDDTDVQRGLATELGLSQIRLPFNEAAGPGETLAAALAMTRTLPAPLSLIWRPALRRLALDCQQRGCSVILTGDGADEWLSENAFLAADRLRSLDLIGIYRLWRTYSRSYHFSRQEALRMLMWRYGARPLLRDAWRVAAAWVGAPGLVPPLWRLPPTISALIGVPLPQWMAPDPTLRARVAERLQETYTRDETMPSSYYLQDTRSRLDAPEKWFREEETFLMGQRIGMPVRQPFWDADLIDVLVRIRPSVRSEGGLSKALVRKPLVRRFPQLGFERQRKTWLGEALLSAISAQSGRERAAIGGIQALGELGVIDVKMFDDAIALKGPQSRLGYTWEILNLEAWVRAH